MILGSIIIILLGMVFLFFRSSAEFGSESITVLIIAILMLAGGLFGLSAKIFSTDRVKRISKGETTITPKQFLKLRKEKEMPVFKGVYVLHNKTRNKYYVGQGINVMARINQHFSGKGNGDVYADWKYGDRFRIKIIPLKGSRRKSLDELERVTINKYNAFSQGYNKTRGNN